MICNDTLGDGDANVLTKLPDMKILKSLLLDSCNYNYVYKKSYDELYLRVFYALQLAFDKNQMQPLLSQHKSYARLQYSTFRLNGC